MWIPTVLLRLPDMAAAPLPASYLDGPNSRSSCFCIASVGITGLHHLAWPNWIIYHDIIASPVSVILPASCSVSGLCCPQFESWRVLDSLSCSECHPSDALVPSCLTLLSSGVFLNCFHGYFFLCCLLMKKKNYFVYVFILPPFNRNNLKS